jgi:hypothetical protein
MNPSHVINSAIAQWKMPLALVKAWTHGEPQQVRIREAIQRHGNVRSYMAVACCGPWCVGLATAQTSMQPKRLTVVCRHIREGMPVNDLPGPFLALAMSEGNGVLISDGQEFRTQDGTFL